MTDNRALWELVEMWRKSSPKPEYECERGVWIDCADELAAILERPVVVSDEMVNAFCRTYYIAPNRKIGPELVRDSIAAALESMVRGKS